MTEFRLVIRGEVRQQVTTWKKTMSDRTATPRARADAKVKFEAFRDAAAALRGGQDDKYPGKRLGYGRDSSDLSDCAEYKVRVGQRRDDPHRTSA